MRSPFRIHISDALLERTAALLASFAEDAPSEGVVYWFGLDLGGNCIVTSLIVPDAHASWGCIATTPEANAEVLRSIVGTPLVLIGQAHSHPGRDVRHSDYDDRQTFPRFEGAISLVVPDYAKAGIHLPSCGVHRFVGGTYRLITPRRVKEHLSVIPAEKDFRRPTRRTHKR